MILKVAGSIEIFKAKLNAFLRVFLCKRQRVSQWFVLNFKTVVLIPKKKNIDSFVSTEQCCTV